MNLANLSDKLRAIIYIKYPWKSEIDRLFCLKSPSVGDFDEDFRQFFFCFWINVQLTIKVFKPGYIFGLSPKVIQKSAIWIHFLLPEKDLQSLWLWTIKFHSGNSQISDELKLMNLSPFVGPKSFKILKFCFVPFFLCIIAAHWERHWSSKNVMQMQIFMFPICQGETVLMCLERKLDPCSKLCQTFSGFWLSWRHNFFCRLLKL